MNMWLTVFLILNVTCYLVASEDVNTYIDNVLGSRLPMELTKMNADPMDLPIIHILNSSDGRDVFFKQGKLMNLGQAMRVRDCRLVDRFSSNKFVCLIRWENLETRHSMEFSDGGITEINGKFKGATVSIAIHKHDDWLNGSPHVNSYEVVRRGSYTLISEIDSELAEEFKRETTAEIYSILAAEFYDAINNAMNGTTLP